MLTAAILLIIVGFFVTVFGILQNTLLLFIFDLNAHMERMLSEVEFELARVFNGPGTITMIIGVLAIAIGIALLFIIRLNNKKLRQVNSNIRNTNKRRKQQGKRVPK